MKIDPNPTGARDEAGFDSSDIEYPSELPSCAVHFSLQNEPSEICSHYFFHLFIYLCEKHYIIYFIQNFKNKIKFTNSILKFTYSLW